MSRTFKIAITALATATAFAPVAMAQTGIKEVSVRVAYGDLDISNPAGGQTLLKRVEAAARQVCDKAVLRTLLKMRSPGKCRSEAIESTVRQLAISTLTLAWSGKYPSTNIAAR